MDIILIYLSVLCKCASLPVFIVITTSTVDTRPVNNNGSNKTITINKHFR